MFKGEETMCYRYIVALVKSILFTFVRIPAFVQEI